MTDGQSAERLTRLAFMREIMNVFGTVNITGDALTKWSAGPGEVQPEDYIIARLKKRRGK